MCYSESCKDVDVVRVAPQCLTSTAAEPFAMRMGTDHTLRDQPFFNSRITFQDDSSLDYDNDLDNITVSSSVFEFQRAARSFQRAGLAPFSRAPPSKWDDAQKWIASPITDRTMNRQPHVEGGLVSRKDNQFGYGNRQTSMKVVLKIPDQMPVPYEESNTRRMELSQEFKETGWQKPVEWEGDLYQSTDWYNTVLTTENFVKQSASKTSAPILVFPDCKSNLQSWYLLYFMARMALNFSIMAKYLSRLLFSLPIYKITYSYCGGV